MDSLINAAARALAVGDPLRALDHVALRNDAPALALRGIAMAQLGDLKRAKELLRKAARAFGAKEAVARARCIVAEAEVALAARDLAWPVKALDAARATLERHGDRINAAHARYLDVRRLVLIGRLAEAESKLAHIDPNLLPPPLRAAHELVVSGIAIRRVAAQQARAALLRAAAAAKRTGIPALIAEVESAVRTLKAPAARLIVGGEIRSLVLEEVELLLASKSLLVDACRFAVRRGKNIVHLARRPVLFTLARTLAESWPKDASREALLAKAFGAKHVDESHRARLRVEIGRLRAALRGLADVEATPAGFALKPRRTRSLIVLAQPIEEEHAGVIAILADGESWASSALALALSASQRTVQRALDDLAAAGKVQSIGQGRGRRWMTPPIPGFTTTLLLPAPMTGP